MKNIKIFKLIRGGDGNKGGWARLATDLYCSCISKESL